MEEKDSSPRPLHSNPSKQTDSGPTPHIRHCQHGNPEYHVQGIEPRESEFRHSHWAVRRWKVWGALSRINASDQRRARFANCGAGMWLEQTTTHDDIRIKCDKCKDRWCAACGSDRSARIVEALAAGMADKTCRFVTLTLRHSHATLADQIDRLYRSFAALRRRVWWGECCSGGAAFLEVKLSKSGMWHPHLHLICTGGFMDQRKLSSEWLAVTGDSSIVDVRAISDHEGRARYVTKYVTKPAPSEVFDSPEKLDEMMLSMGGRRLCLTWGTWRGIKLDGDVGDDRQWVTCGRAEAIFSKALAGDLDATRLTEAALRKWPSLQRYIDALLDALPPPETLGLRLGDS